MLTENYEKMCSKAKEIQKLFKFEMGDWYIEDYPEDTHHIVLDENIVSMSVINTFIKKGVIWLPTQEQLWSMLPEIKDKVHVVFRFNKFLSGKYLSKTQISQQVAFVVLMNMPYDYDGMSISELLLCFIMKEKYNKIWNGKDWEKYD